MHSRKLCALALLGVIFALVGAGSAGAQTALGSHGQLIQVRANTNQSSNWFGYQQGTLEQGGTLFNSITGDWTVPTASLHGSGQDEFSSDWIGIGGGCVDATCTVTDSTLIQTGTEQDVTANGQTSYSAWWELVPASSISISMTVEPGDHMHAAISEVVPDSDLWTITLQDVTRNESFTQTVPYPSTHLTAEWIEETPLLIGTNAGFAALPSLTSPVFDLATVNGRPASLSSSEQMQLIDSNGNVIGTPSAPDPDADGFNACTWATSCAAPSGS
jgi:Peptidase A4 family